MIPGIGFWLWTSAEEEPPTALPSVFFATQAEVNAKARPAFVISGPPRGP